MEHDVITREAIAALWDVTPAEIGNVYADGSADRLEWGRGLRCDGCSQDQCLEDSCIGCKSAQTRLLSGYYPAR